MEFRILGSLDVSDGPRHLTVRGAKPRALLAVLLLDANDVVSSDRLIDGVWGETPPRSAAKLIQGYVSELRRSAGLPIDTQSPGYRLRIGTRELDLDKFLRLCDEARDARAAADLPGASRLLAEALAVWRGEPLADVELHGAAAVAVARLSERRLDARLDRLDVELALGRHVENVGELEAIVAEVPFRERPRAQLMLALYRSGRQADALSVYRQTRTLLVEQLGLEPGEELRALEAAILRHDPALDAVAATAGAADDDGVRSSEVALALPREERRLAAILLADVLVGTPATGIDPESSRAVWEAAIAQVERDVTRHGGVVEHVLGNHVLALFGVPQAHEDDVDRAVRAAVSASSTAAAVAAGDEATVHVRLAVAIGDVLVATDGGGRRRLIGAPVAAVEELLGLAPVGGVVVTDAVRHAAGDTIECRKLSTMQDAAPAWEVTELRTPAPAGRRPLTLQAALVGRDAQLRLLESEIDVLRNEERACLVTVLGEAGVGKSRLAHELVQRLAVRASSVAVRHGRCLAYGNASYAALADVLRAESGILADDPADVMADKVGRAVEALFGDRSAARYVEALVGVRQHDSLSREDLFDAWRRMLERMARRASPLVLVLEDLHWADDGLLDFVDHLTGWADAPVLVLALARPALLERRPGWGGGRRNATTIMLEPLAPADTARLLRELLAAEPSEELSDVFVGRSEGNPLFGEEILHMLAEQGALLQSAPGRWDLAPGHGGPFVPPSIRAVIGARLDALPSDEVEVIQMAAVVGRVFWVGSVQRLSGRSRRETRELLARLRERDLVVAHESSSFAGEPELAFRHVLIRDVAYESLPKSRRIDAHVAMATWAAERAPGREKEIAELLATHVVAALRFLRELGEYGSRREDVQRSAYQWARAAGRRARRLWQQREAVRWLGEALDSVRGLEVDAAELATLREEYAHACEGVKPYDEVALAYEDALAAYHAGGDLAAAGRMEAWRAFVGFQTGDDEAVRDWSSRALTHLEPLGESRELVLALVILGWAHRRSGRIEEAEPLLRRAVAMAGRIGDEATRAQADMALGKCLQQSGRADEGLPLLGRAVEVARSAGDLGVLLRALLDLSEAHEEVTGAYRRAEELVREGLEHARRAGHRQQIAWMESNLADYLVDMGRLAEAEPLSASGLEAARHVGEPRRIALTLPTVSFLHLARGRLAEAAAALDELRSLMEAVDEVYAAAWVPLLGGMLARARGRDNEAAAVLQDGATRQAGRPEIWGAVNLYAETVHCLVHLARPDEADEPRRQLLLLAGWSAPAAAFHAWADGLLEPGGEQALAKLHNARSRFERLERRVELGRTLTDLARVEATVGLDPTPTIERAGDILRGCGATIFLTEVPEPG